MVISARPSKIFIFKFFYDFFSKDYCSRKSRNIEHTDFIKMHFPTLYVWISIEKVFVASFGKCINVKSALLVIKLLTMQLLLNWLFNYFLTITIGETNILYLGNHLYIYKNCVFDIEGTLEQEVELGQPVWHAICSQ